MIQKYECNVKLMLTVKFFRLTVRLLAQLLERKGKGGAYLLGTSHRYNLLVRFQNMFYNGQSQSRSTFLS